MQTKFLILIASVFVISLVFAGLIWWQLGRIQKKALAAKERQAAQLKAKEEQQKEMANDIIQDENNIIKD